jgi:hypothetical protein
LYEKKITSSLAQKGTKFKWKYQDCFASYMLEMHGVLNNVLLTSSLSICAVVTLTSVLFSDSWSTVNGGKDFDEPGSGNHAFV